MSDKAIMLVMAVIIAVEIRSIRRSRWILRMEKEMQDV